MCGRYSIFATADAIKERFHATLQDGTLQPRYNAAPSQNMPVILNIDPHTVVMAKWGFVPFWAKEPADKAGIINSRAETLTTKVTFKKAFQEHRCLVLCDGFYEWKKTKEGKIPYRIALKDEALFAFAGIWRSLTDEQGKAMTTFAIVTTEPNSQLLTIHNRMHAILAPENEKEWLEKPRIELLRPYEAESMVAFPVSMLINNPRNDTQAVLSAV